MKVGGWVTKKCQDNPIFSVFHNSSQWRPPSHLNQPKRHMTRQLRLNHPQNLILIPRITSQKGQKGNSVEMCFGVGLLVLVKFSVDVDQFVTCDISNPIHILNITSQGEKTFSKGEGGLASDHESPNKEKDISCARSCASECRSRHASTPHGVHAIRSCDKED